MARFGELRRFQWTGIVADGKRCHTNKVPCHTDLEKRFADFLDGAKDVVRYFKNERFGFSVTYYESNRPRQYYPDFIIAARDADGREVMWLAETKGEIRPNTALKSEAARLWCEKMSGTKYGQWRYLFVQQRKLEAALAAGVRSLAELAEASWFARPEPQLRLISLEDERVKREAFKTLLPLYTLKAAAGYFGNGEAVEPEGWVEADGSGDSTSRCSSAGPLAARWSRRFATATTSSSAPSRRAHGRERVLCAVPRAGRPRHGRRVHGEALLLGKDGGRRAAGGTRGSSCRRRIPSISRSSSRLVTRSKSRWWRSTSRFCEELDNLTASGLLPAG